MLHADVMVSLKVTRAPPPLNAKPTEEVNNPCADGTETENVRSNSCQAESKQKGNHQRGKRLCTMAGPGQVSL